MTTKANIEINQRIVSLAHDRSEAFETKFRKLRSIWETERENFNAVNLSTLIISLAKSKPSHSRIDPAFFSEFAQVAAVRMDEFNSVALANTVWAFAKLHIYDEQLFMRAAEVSLKKIREFHAQGLSITAWSFATMGLAEEELFEAIAQCAETRIAEFSAQALSNTVWAFAKLGFRNEELFRIVAIQALNSIETFRPQNLANTLSSFAKVNIRDDALFKAIGDSTRESLREFSAQNISNITWALATMGVRNTELLGDISREVQSKIKDFNAQGLSNTAWGFAKLHYFDESLFDALAEAIILKLKMFNPQGLANTAWAFATIGKAHTELLNRLAEASMPCLADFKPQNLSNLAWAFATLEQTHMKLFGAIAQTAQQKLQDFNSQNLANTAWAFAKIVETTSESCPLEVEGGFFHELKSEVQQRLSEFDALELSTLTSAFFRLRVDGLYDALSDECLRKKERFKPPNVASLFSALAEANCYQENLLREFSEWTAEKVDIFQAQDLSIVLKALASLNFQSSILIDALKGSLGDKFGDIHGTQVVRVIWATAILEEELLEEAWASLLEHYTQLSFSLEEIIKLYQCARFCGRELPEILDHQAQEALGSISVHKPSRSLFCREIACYLSELDLGAKAVYVDGLFLDFLLEERNLVIDCQTSASRFVGGGEHLQGEAVFRDGLIARNQLKSLIIIEEHWKGLEEKKTWLVEQLR